MARLTIVVEVPDDVDPTLADPHDVADELLDLLGDGWVTAPEFVAAEWGHHLPEPAAQLVPMVAPPVAALRRRQDRLAGDR